MWVDQKELKLYITGPDMPRILAATQLVKDLISRAPVNVNCAGVEDEVGASRTHGPVFGFLHGPGGVCRECRCRESLAFAYTAHLA